MKYHHTTPPILREPVRRFREVIWLPFLMIALLAGSGVAIAETVHVSVGGGIAAFGPDSVTIHAGDTVEWDWEAPVPGEPGHSVTSGANGVSDGLFESSVHPYPYTFSFTFMNVGTYEYFCRPHFEMGMIGHVQVVEGTSIPGTLGNISTRLRVGTGDNGLIGGFIVAGTQPKKIIARAIGPSLPFPGALADPTLELRDSSGGLIRSNDNWRADQETEIMATLVPPSQDLEAAIVATLPANNSAYTAIVRGVNNTTGVGLIEIYDLDRTVDSKLSNISTRGLVQSGDDVLIAGTIVLGTSTQKLLIRAIGPSLTLPGALANPAVELRDANGTLIRGNDNWRSDQEADIIATTIPPANDLEAAILATLPSGGASYTAIVRGVGDTTGVAVVEVYALN